MTRAGLNPSLAVGCVVAAVLIGHAMQISNGFYNSTALAWLSAGMAIAWCGLLLPRCPAAAIWIACFFGIWWEVLDNLNDIPMANFSSPWVMFFYHSLALPVLTAATLGAMFLRRLSKRVFIPLLLIAHVATGAWLLRNSGEPYTSDIYVFTRLACQAAERGQNPYTIDFPDIYDQSPNGGHVNYPPHSVVNGRVQFGYAYMPLSFMFAFAGHELAGDFRVGNELALAAAAGLIAFSGDGLAAAAAGLLLLTPKGFFMISMGSPEPVVMLCLAAVIFCRRHKPAWTPAALGLLIVSKQYMPLALMSAPLLAARPWTWKGALTAGGIAALAAAAVTAPLAIADPRAFFRSTVVWHLTSPFHSDALNFAAAWVHAGHAPPPNWLAFGAAVTAGIVCLRFAPRSAAGFAISVALVLLTFFAAAKQAYYHYYLVTVAALCCAVAAGDEP